MVRLNRFSHPITLFSIDTLENFLEILKTFCKILFWIMVDLNLIKF